MNVTPEIQPQSLPEILIAEDEHRVVDDAVNVLKADQNIFCRGNVLVRIIRSGHPADQIHRVDGSATIQVLPAANLRERLTRCAEFRQQRGKNIVPAHPPNWLVSAIIERGEWNALRPLRGVSDSPILRRDGSIWQTPGYDADSGVLYEPPSSGEIPTMPAMLSKDDAVTAWERLREVVCDFSFQSPAHQAAWLAGLLSPIARFAFDGPAPLFLIDANVRGAGKGLLAQSIGRVVLGREMPVSTYAHDSDEMRKRITAIAIAGDRQVLLDNLDGKFGNDALDRALTATRWKDRVLGSSREIDLPLLPVWYATGNNVQVAADTARRIIHIRIEVLHERPEERSTFTHPNLIAWITQHRIDLLSSALLILAAYCRAGRPKHNLTPFGSFEGWSDLVREAVVWLGLPDPCETRAGLAESSDTTKDVLADLIGAWSENVGWDRGVSIPELLARLFPAERQYMPMDDSSCRLRAALEQLVECPPGKAPTPRQVGNSLRQVRRRVVGDSCLDIDGRSKHGKNWRLRRLCDQPGVSGASGASFLSHAGKQN